ncbi:hypothetical protein AB0O01_00945 [Streptomyces sp. NPDC093252]|uniref:hypothetical protein n=1 Tax=Streptomyces sp. NPDC093252 TaxID=3154980 RepID=UPI003422D04C
MEKLIEKLTQESNWQAWIAANSAQGADKSGCISTAPKSGCISATPKSGCIS